MEQNYRRQLQEYQEKLKIDSFKVSDLNPTSQSNRDGLEKNKA